MDTSTAPPPAGADWTALASLLAPHLAQAAGPDTRPVSIVLELADAQAAPTACRGWVERATRTLVFVGAEARTPSGDLAASASAVFRRTAPAA